MYETLQSVNQMPEPSAQKSLDKSSVEHRLFVALDYPDAASALTLAKRLAALNVSFKVGMQLFYAEGASIVHALQDLCSSHGQTPNPVFVDLKLHDIPNTVSGAVSSLVRHGVDFLNVHVQGGTQMMQAAVKAAQQTADSVGNPAPKLLGVTLLTSLSETDLQRHLLVESASPREYVQHLALQAKACGLDGVVCSAMEAPWVREACGKDFLLVTPGIRLADTKNDDQSRIVTPSDALRQGADYLVVGRPITDAPDPLAAARRILADMHQALV